MTSEELGWLGSDLGSDQFDFLVKNKLDFILNQVNLYINFF
jgi:hypothetical protein